MVSRRSVLSQGLWLAAGAGAAWLLRDRILWPGPTASFSSGEVSSGWFDFATPRQLLPTVQVRANGAPLNALLDSGAQRSVISTDVAQKLGLGKGFSLPVVAFGVGGSAQMGRGGALDVEIGQLRLQRLQVAMLELGPIASAEGLGTPLVLGQDVLRQLVAEIDFPTRRLQFHARDNYAAPDDASALGVQRDAGALKATVQVNGRPIQAVVDTGASAALSVSDTVARTAGLLDQPGSGEAASIVLGGVIHSQVVNADSVGMAGELLRDVQVQIYQDRSLPGFPHAVLGVEALRHFRVVLDYGASRILLRRSDETPAFRRGRRRRA